MKIERHRLLQIIDDTHIYGDGDVTGDELRQLCEAALDVLDETRVRSEIGHAAAEHEGGLGMWDTAAQRLGFESYAVVCDSADAIAVKLRRQRKLWKST